MNKILKNKSGNVILELREDNGSAWLTIKHSGSLVDEQDILDLIDEAGIKTGFDEAMALMRKKGLEKEYDTPFPIAISNMVQEQGELKLCYHFDSSLTEAMVGSFKLPDLAGYSYAQQGECLAAYSDNIFEREGSIYDIFGELITPPELNDIEARKNAGINVSYQDGKFFADRTGYPYLDSEGRICILSSLHVSPELCDPENPIRSPLALEIDGNIRDCNIAVANDLVIHGNVDNCSIHCDKDLVVDGYIRECKNPGIRVLGSLKVAGIEISRVLVRRDMEYTDSITDSNVSCDGNIIGHEGDSAIRGGLVQAGGDIVIDIAGGDGETEIEIAISPFYRALLMQMTKEMVRLKDIGDDEAVAELQERISRCEAELDEQLNSFLKRSPEQKKSVKVRSEVFPKTIFRILKHVYQFKSTQYGIELYEKE